MDNILRRSFPCAAADDHIDATKSRFFVSEESGDGYHFKEPCGRIVWWSELLLDRHKVLLLGS